MQEKQERFRHLIQFQLLGDGCCNGNDLHDHIWWTFCRVEGVGTFDADSNSHKDRTVDVGDLCCSMQTYHRPEVVTM